MKEELTFDKIVEYIGNNIPFSYSRFGDGEWAALLQKGSQNCDGHKYFKDLGIRLKSILESQPSYYIGLQTLAKNQNQGNKEFDRLVAKNEWSTNELIHRASIKGGIDRMIKACEGKRVILVGNRHLERLNFYTHHVQILDKNCWLQYTEINAKLLELLNKKNTVVLYCASMMTNVLIDDFAHLPIIQIDCGSALDPYVGRKIRSYHRNLQIRYNFVD